MTTFLSNTLAWLAALTLLGGCLAQSPISAAEDALGGEPPGSHPGPFHRPGQPCLTCHSAANSPGGLEYVIAGTVFNFADDSIGIDGVQVVLTDRDGQETVARTNRAGNFFITVDQGGGQPGQLNLSSDLRYPLRVRIERGDQVQEMQGLIGRDSSCADCHRGDPNAHNNGPIYLSGVTP